jgi:uncharacterized protein (TIGR03086 family)
MPGEMLAYFRFTDHLIHAWDLARAIGADERLDAELVEYCVEKSRPFASSISATGRFHDAVPVPADADPQVTMLAMHGRDAAVDLSVRSDAPIHRDHAAG